MKRETIDLLVLDLRLPGEDGMQIARKLREDSQLPIIMLTGRKDEADRVMGLELGADDYLTKPFSPRELLARIRALLRRARAQETVADGLQKIRAYRFAGFELNVRLRRLKAPAGEHIALTNNEFNLLAAFLARRSACCRGTSCSDLSRLHNDEVYDRSIDVQVGRLRRKIQPARARPSSSAPSAARATCSRLRSRSSASVQGREHHDPRHACDVLFVRGRGAARVFPDKLGLTGTDVGGGWLIFDAPEADLGVHPTEGESPPPAPPTSRSTATTSTQTVAELRARGRVHAGGRGPRLRPRHLLQGPRRLQGAALPSEIRQVGGRVQLAQPSATTPLTLYGAAGSGSVAVEAALTLLGIPYDLVEGATWAEEAARDRVAAQNPMRQIPTLVLPGGEVMTESAAILIWLATIIRRRGSRLLPIRSQRAPFLRWMSYVSSAIYALHWIKPDVRRIGAPPELRDAVVDAVHERIAFCWSAMDAQLDPGRYLLGDALTMLDLYVTVVSRFGPWRLRFYEAAPKMSAGRPPRRRRAAAAAFWAKRFPFDEHGA